MCTRGDVGGNSLYRCSSGAARTDSAASAVRPLVSIPLTSCEITIPEGGEGTYTIEAKK